MFRNVCLWFCLLSVARAAEDASSPLQKALDLAHQGKLNDAIEAIGAVIAENPATPEAWYYRGSWNERLGRKEAALVDYNKVLALEPTSAQTYQRRGAIHFQLGHVAESLKDFDKYLELVPSQKPAHWQRGISLYYVEKFLDGQRQFELHQSVNPDDVENAVWHFLCVAKQHGVEKARERLIPIRRDGRVPMMEIYDLYKGQGSPDKIWEAVNAGDPSKHEKNERNFYAHLYLGLYEEALGKPEKSLEHMKKAVEEFPTAHYMGDVARVHYSLRKGAAKK